MANNKDINGPFESDRGPVVVLTLAEAQALDWVTDAGIEQLTVENNMSSLSMDVKRDLDRASDGAAKIQAAIRSFVQRNHHDNS